MRLVQFDLDGHRFALPASDVVEVLRAASPSPLPGAPSVVLGLLNVRGTLVPLFDIRSRFGVAARALRASDHLVIAEAGPRRVAISVDAVRSVMEVSNADITSATDLPAASAGVAGVVRLEDGTLVIADLRTFLTDAESARLDLALAQ